MPKYLPILLFMIISVTCVIKSAHTIRIDINHQHELNTLTLTLESPCPELQVAFETGGDPNVWSFNQYGVRLCEIKFNEATRDVYDSLDNCVFKTSGYRTKRSLLSMATQLRNLAPKLKSSAVTNFIKSELRESVGDVKEIVLKELKSRLKKATRRLLTEGRERHQIEIADISHSSETASHHLNELNEVEAVHMPNLPWALFHCFREIVTGAANLKAISNRCNKHEFAVSELGELMGSELLANLQNAKIENVFVNREDNTIEFVHSQGGKKVKSASAEQHPTNSPSKDAERNQVCESACGYGFIYLALAWAIYFW